MKIPFLILKFSQRSAFAYPYNPKKKDLTNPTKYAVGYKYFTSRELLAYINSVSIEIPERVTDVKKTNQKDSVRG
jgi:hypothetical protein